MTPKIACFGRVILLVTLFALYPAGRAFCEEEQSVPMEVVRFVNKPIDTIDAERVRVWIPIEGAYTCQVLVDIFDSTGAKVCHFLNTLLGKGYYNFYWDKRDSAGQFVAPGNYSYTAKVCGHPRTGKLSVVYKGWEKNCTMTVIDSVKPPEFIITTNRDSAHVSLAIYFNRGRLAEEFVKDTLLMSGEHHFLWVPKLSYTPAGNYRIECQVGDYLFDAGFKYQP